MTIRNLLSVFLVLGAMSLPGNAPAAGGGQEGNGNFVTEDAQVTLKSAATELAAQIRNASDGVFPPFLPDWNKEALATLIETVRAEPTEEAPLIREDGSRLDRLFYYGVENGKKIEYGRRGRNPVLVALRSYFERYGVYPARGRSDIIHDVHRTVQAKLLYEASHVVWRNDNDAADELSERAMKKLFPGDYSGYQVNPKPCRFDDIPEKREVKHVLLDSVSHWATDSNSAKASSRLAKKCQTEKQKDEKAHPSWVCGCVGDERMSLGWFYDTEKRFTRDYVCTEPVKGEDYRSAVCQRISVCITQARPDETTAWLEQKALTLRCDSPI